LFVCLFVCSQSTPVFRCFFVPFVCLFAAVYFPPIEVNKRVINNDRGPFVSKCVTATVRQRAALSRLPAQRSSSQSPIAALCACAV
jgi:hypothetical protein